jgi:hypothetical protein
MSLLDEIEVRGERTVQPDTSGLGVMMRIPLPQERLQMAATTKRTVRIGRIYHIQVANTDYSTFIWQAGVGFCGRVENQPQVPQCRGRTVVAVREQLCEALAASLKA